MKFNVNKLSSLVEKFHEIEETENRFRFQK